MITNRFKSQLSNYENGDDINIDYQDEDDIEIEAEIAADTDNDDFLDEIEIEEKTWNLADGNYRGTVTEFHKTAHSRLYLAVRLDDGIIFQTTSPIKTNAEYGIGRIIMRLKEKYGTLRMYDIIDLRIGFTVANNAKDGITYSNMTTVKILKKKVADDD